MRRMFSTGRRAAATLAALGLITGGVAYAYLASTGSGTGTGNVTASSSNLVLTFSQPDFTKLPQTQTVNIYATNNGQSVEQFNGLTAFSVSSTNSTTCPGGSFVAGTPATTAQEIPADGAAHLVGTVSVTFTDLAQAQNGCIGSGSSSYSASSN
ncbi:MAG TPA: hypothetical protein VFP55_10870 [Solirubrobacteraceae bacterium]|nr:hypothetical protein [Solirubrobacteraceae bacterium]